VKPTYETLLELHDTYAQYEYDHKRPTVQQTETAGELLATSVSTQEQLTARAYGEYVGAWYWSNRIKQWVDPPRKVWVHV